MSDKERALAAPALADNGDEFARRDRESDILERLGLAFPAEIAHIEAAQLDLRRSAPPALGILHGVRFKRLVGFAGEIGKDQVLIFDALGRREHVALHQDILKFLDRRPARSSA